jgi:hypothetical protein
MNCIHIAYTPPAEVLKFDRPNDPLKVKVKQSRYRPGVAQRIHDNGTGWW